jgi:ABC-type branched-subunit amino acid transport system permease subunit
MGANRLGRLQGPFFIAVAALLLALPGVVDNYILHVMARLYVYVLVALGLNLLTGYTGQVSLGHAAFFAIGAYTAASRPPGASASPSPSRCCGRMKRSRGPAALHET